MSRGDIWELDPETGLIVRRTSQQENVDDVFDNLPDAFKNAWKAEFERSVPVESFPDLISLYSDSQGALIDLDELEQARQFTDWVKKAAKEIRGAKARPGPNLFSPYRRARRFALATYCQCIGL